MSEIASNPEDSCDESNTPSAGPPPKVRSVTGTKFSSTQSLDISQLQRSASSQNQYQHGSTISQNHNESTGSFLSNVIQNRPRFSVVRNIFRNRNDDYYRDDPSGNNVGGVGNTSRGQRAQLRHQRRLIGGSVQSMLSTYNNNRNNRNNTSRMIVEEGQDNDDNDQTHYVGGLCTGGCSSKTQRRAYSTKILKSSTTYRILLILACIILLFGQPIRELIMSPYNWDILFDVVFVMVFLFFVIDIILRCLSDPQHYLFPNNNNNNNNNTVRDDNNDQQHRGRNNRRCYCCPQQRFNFCFFFWPSFLFWCDCLSTLTLLYDISFINYMYFSQVDLTVDVDTFGYPMGGFEQVNAPQPVRWNGSLLITVLQTLRVARFIRSSRMVKWSKSINWYLVLNICNPCLWFRFFTCRDIHKERRKSASDFERTNSSRRKSSALLLADPHHHYEAEHHGGPTTTASSSRLVHEHIVVPSSSSWGHAGMGALAAVKAQHSTNTQPGLRGWMARTKHRVMLSRRYSFDTDDFRRQLAATRIQRAWRHVLWQRMLAEESNDDDVAWRGGRQQQGPSMNPMERQFRQRSFLVSNVMSKAKSRRNFQMNNKKQPSTHSFLKDSTEKRRVKSQVGSAMRELTGQRVAIGIIVAFLLTALFTYVEQDATRASTMVMLHSQTETAKFADKALLAARSSVIPDLMEYELADGALRTFDVDPGLDQLRARERLQITVRSNDGTDRTTVGLFSIRSERRGEALVSLLSTLFILLVWFCGVTAFSGPVMVLVVIPIERMVRLLGMLMMDPLGYQSTSRYKRFVAEEDEITKNTRWTKEILKGMETSFLMSTILRIGSLMQVGFGSAGSEIIRNNLEKGQSKNTLILNSKGSTVSCIFLFCDIRNFTDATECLQEEVFVFTNRVAAVVHSNCHAYGGSANKNVGDAFLLSWLLEESTATGAGADARDSSSSQKSGENFLAKNHQADKALLSVVKICMALYHDDHYLEPLSEAARGALCAKLKKRKGPVVQAGFGLHAGRAVQGAIGSQRKIDATYVSEAVEMAEFLESSTKKYGLKALMSDSFHRLLQPGQRRRCRKVDQILIRDDDEDEEEEGDVKGEMMELFTYDMHIEALHKESKDISKSEAGLGSENGSDGGSKRGTMSKIHRSKRLSFRYVIPGLRDDTEDPSQSGYATPGGGGGGEHEDGSGKGPMKLVLPTGPALYNANVWTSEDMRKIRQLYSDGLFFQKFNSGLQSFYAKDWDHAKQCFDVILDRFEDGPSRYFMNQIEKHGGKPPRNFAGYGTA